MSKAVLVFSVAFIVFCCGFGIIVAVLMLALDTLKDVLNLDNLFVFSKGESLKIEIDFKNQTIRIPDKNNQNNNSSLDAEDKVYLYVGKDYERL